MWTFAVDGNDVVELSRIRGEKKVTRRVVFEGMDQGQAVAVARALCGDQARKQLLWNAYNRVQKSA